MAQEYGSGNLFNNRFSCQQLTKNKFMTFMEMKADTEQTFNKSNNHLTHCKQNLKPWNT